MTHPSIPDQQLDECKDVSYTEPPKSIPLYTDSTKWIVGLATGSFLLTGSILTTHPDSTLPTLVPVAIAIFSMTISAACGVRALQGYTRLANLIEVHASKKACEVKPADPNHPSVRLVTRERVKRWEQITWWVKQSNIAYEAMTYTFAVGLLGYLVFGGVYLFSPDTKSPVTFTASAYAESPVLGLIHDGQSKSDCVVVRAVAGITCRTVTQSAK
jgi:hypothetical protein